MKKIIYLISAVFMFSCANDNFDKQDLNDQKESELYEINKGSYFVTQDKAISISDSMFNSGQARNTSNRTLKNSISIKDKVGNVVFYINNYEGGGFVILAADMRSIPVLAYSFENSFEVDEEGYPEALEQWLEFATNQIVEIREKNLPKPKEFEVLWQSALNGTIREYPIELMLCDGFQSPVTIVEPLLKTKWGQNEGFNDNMPLAVPQHCSSIGTGNNRYYAGCVPIAIAQTIRFFEYPNNFSYNQMYNIQGTYETRRLIQNLHSNIYYFYQNHGTAAEAFIAPPQLTYSCDGTWVQAYFPIDLLLKKEYNYSTADTYSGSFDHNIILSEVLQERPVILSGRRNASSSGHMWVADGIEKVPFCLDLWGRRIKYKILRIHMNWGWNGLENGFYTYGSFNPGTYDYNYGIRIVYNIKK